VLSGERSLYSTSLCGLIVCSTWNISKAFSPSYDAIKASTLEDLYRKDFSAIKKFLLARMSHCCNLAVRMKPETNTLEPAVSAADIAKRLDRSHTGVKKAIARLKIEPVQIVGIIKLYPCDAVEEIEAAMRKPNTASL
jgi:hypothetical protein